MAETKPPAKQQDDATDNPPKNSATDSSLPAPANEPETPPVKGTYKVKAE